jgi:hypothetical protein
MADIDVVPKHHSMTWLWIVIAAVVVLALWWALGRQHTTTSQTGHLVTPSDTFATSLYIDSL